MPAPAGAGPHRPVKMRHILHAAAAYFAAVFAAGFLLGVLRTLVLVPLLGELAAVLLELPVILGFAWLVCVRILRRWPMSAAAAAGMGLVAFLFLMVAEAGLSLLLAGRSLVEHLALYALLPQQVGLAGQLVFGLLPWVQGRGACVARSAAGP
jgi:hypothetical protein